MARKTRRFSGPKPLAAQAGENPDRDRTCRFHEYYGELQDCTALDHCTVVGEMKALFDRLSAIAALGADIRECVAGGHDETGGGMTPDSAIEAVVALAKRALSLPESKMDRPYAEPHIRLLASLGLIGDDSKKVVRLVATSGGKMAKMPRPGGQKSQTRRAS